MSQTSLAQMLDLAKWHWTAKDYPRAEAVGRQILQLDPNNVKAMQLLGDLAARGLQPQVAIELLTKALAIEPQNVDILVSLGNAYAAAGALDQAITAFRRAIELRPDSMPAHNNLSIMLKKAGRVEESIEVLRRIVELRPDFADALAVLANALVAVGRPQEALEFFRRSIQLAPKNSATRANFGGALCSAGFPKDAVTECQYAIDLGNHSAEAYNHLGNALSACDRLKEASVAYRQAITLRPDFSESWMNLGIALRNLGFLDEAIAAYRKSIDINPDNPGAFNVLGNALRDRGHRAAGIQAYQRALELRPTYRHAHDNLIYAMLFHPESTQAMILDEHRKWNEIHAAPLHNPNKKFDNDPKPDRPIRVGYVSSDFRNHVVGFNLLPMFMNHDHGRFHITCYSSARGHDRSTEKFIAAADQWREITGVPDEEVAGQIAADGIDILVDLALHMSGNRLLIFARKPAPIAVTFAGYPGTTGMTAIDYRLTDPHLDPPGLNDAYYSEETVRLPDSFWVYWPMTDLPAVNELPAQAAGHVTFGCLNNFAKLNEVALGWWSRLLQAVPTSRIMILCPHGQQRDEAIAALGVAAERVEFVDFQGRVEYLQNYRRIDIGLDTFPYNGHTTSLDALWMGVPVVSLCGQTAVSRAGLSQASNLGLTEWVATDQDECVRIAAELGGDLARLADLRRNLRPRMKASPLMDPVLFTRNIESAYQMMWHRWCLANAPQPA